MSTTENPITKQEKPIVPVVEAPVSPNAETDKRVSEVLNEKKKKKHPVEARIAELTKKNAAIEEKAAKDKAELEAKLAEQNEKNIAAELERRKAANEAADKRPNREEFPGDSKGTADYTEAMAKWVLRQQEKIQPKITTTAPAAEPAKLAPEAEAVLKQEFNDYQQSGAEFNKRNPDFNDTLQKAFERGLIIRPLAGRAIMRLRAPEVAYYLAKPENEAETRKFMQMDDMSQSIEIGKIAQRLAVNPNDFISKAGNPGTRINGSANVEVRREEMSTDEYLKQREQDFRTGIRRRRR